MSHTFTKKSVVLWSETVPMYFVTAVFVGAKRLWQYVFLSWADVPFSFYFPLRTESSPGNTWEWRQHLVKHWATQQNQKQPFKYRKYYYYVCSTTNIHITWHVQTITLHAQHFTLGMHVIVEDTPQNMGKKLIDIPLNVLYIHSCKHNLECNTYVI